MLAVLMAWIEAITGSSPLSWMSVAVAPVAAYSVVQLIEGWLMTLWVQSQSLHMSAVTVMIVLLIGGTIAGVYGLLLALPILGCARILAEELLLPKQPDSRHPNVDT